MMSDVYVLAPERSASTAMAFLDEFIPQRDFSADAEDPGEVLGISGTPTIAEVFVWLEKHSGSSYNCYFRNRDDQEPYHAIVAWNDDGSLVLGLSVSQQDSSSSYWLSRLQRFGAGAGFIGVEEPPPVSRVEFLARAAVQD